MVKVVVLDSGPLGLLAAPARIPAAAACHAWADGLRAAGCRIVVPEITDYEVRRELLRLGNRSSLGRLNALDGPCRYVPLTTAVMRRSAQLWGHARRIGRPAAADEDIDADMILVAQAESLRVANIVIATTNVRHLQPFIAAELWSTITH